MHTSLIWLATADTNFWTRGIIGGIEVVNSSAYRQPQ